MLRIIRQWLKKSPNVHLREHGVASMADLVDLIDRFIDDKLNYGLEWDDFISWSHANPNIDAIRLRISATEPLFFSKDQGDLDKAVSLLVGERNRAAALAGLQPRA